MVLDRSPSLGATLGAALASMSVMAPSAHAQSFGFSFGSFSDVYTAPAIEETTNTTSIYSAPSYTSWTADYETSLAPAEPSYEPPSCGEFEVLSADDRTCECDVDAAPDRDGVCTSLEELDALVVAAIPAISANLTVQPPTLSTVLSAGGVYGEAMVANGIRVESDTRLVVSGRAVGDPLVVDATPKRFTSWEAFFGHAQSQLGATLVMDASGEIVGATGRYSRSGSVSFQDGGTIFDAHDYVAAHLGGLDGAFEVGSEIVELTPSGLDGSVAYLHQTEPACDPTGENCIEGHTWVTHVPLYHSVGSRTKQVSGGTVPVQRSYCESGVPVVHDGSPMCRLRDLGNWEYNPQTGALEPALDDPNAELYRYVPRQTEWVDALRNTLSVNATGILGPVSTVEFEKVVENQREVELGEWAIWKDALEDSLGQAIAVKSIQGMCGRHASRTPISPIQDATLASSMTSDGATGEDDILCPGVADPLALTIQGAAVVVNEVLND